MRGGAALAAVLALIGGGFAAYRNGWGVPGRPTERFSVSVDPARATELDADGAQVLIPRRGTVRRHMLTVEAADERDELQFATAHGRRLDIELDGKLRRRATLAFDLPDDAQHDSRFFAITRRDSGARWRAVTGTVSGRSLRVRARHFSQYQLASYSPSAIGRRVRDIYRETVDSRVDPPDCDRVAGDGSADVTPGDDPPIYACLERTGDDYILTIHSNRAVGMTVPVPGGWRHERTSSPTLGEGASALLTQIGEALPGTEGGGAVLLPATGSVTLRSSGPRPARIRVFADNSGSVLDLLLVAISKSKDEKVRAQFAKYAKCLFEHFGKIRDRDVKGTIRSAASCLDDGIPLLARVLLVGDVMQAAAANLDALRGKADGTVRVRFEGVEDDAPEIQTPVPIRTPRPPAPDARRAGAPSCAEYDALPGPEADAVLDRLADAYGDHSSRSLRRLSVAAFCRLNSGRSIAGVYGGGSEGVEPATEVPTCAEYLQLGDAQADAVLDLIATRHNDDSPISTRRLSAAAFCQLYPGRMVDGIYGGSG